MTTERDELVERVIAAFKDGMTDEELAHTAIAECEGELTKLRAEIAGSHAEENALEAEVAAMRGLVEMARDELGVPTSNYPAPVGNAVEFLNAALSPGAGKRILDVVKAARVVDDFNNLRKVLAAPGGEHD